MTPDSTAERFAEPDVSVDVGGMLHAHRLSSGPGTPVIAVHGITANALSWVTVADRLGGAADVLAHDLRGRGCSSGVGPPYGLSVHAGDLWALADAAGYGRVRLIGHSMGAFVAALAAARQPNRVEQLVLVDGGLPLHVPRLARRLPDRLLLKASLGKSFDRLDRTFPSKQAYLEFWAEHPAVGPLLRGSDGSAVAAYLLHDLGQSGREGGWRSRCRLDAVRVDGLAVIAGLGTGAAQRVVADGVPVEFRWAPRGLQNQRRGLYSERSLARQPLTGIAVTRLTGNHYSALFGSNAAALARTLTT